MGSDLPQVTELVRGQGPSPLAAFFTTSPPRNSGESRRQAGNLQQSSEATPTNCPYGTSLPLASEAENGTELTREGAWLLTILGNSSARGQMTVPKGKASLEAWAGARRSDSSGGLEFPVGLERKD